MQEPNSRQQLLERLHHQYGGAVFYKCVRMLGDRAEAEDAVQETFLRAYGLLDGLNGRPPQAHLPWLYCITTYVCLHFLRTRRRKRPEPMGELPAQALSVEAGQDEAAAAREQLLRIAAELDERDQQILVGTLIDGMSQEDVAQSLSISRRAVVKRLTALRKRLAAVGRGGAW